MSHLSSYLNYILRMLRIIFFFFLFHFDSYVAFVSSVMIIYTYEKFEFMFRLAFYRTQQGKNKIRDCYHTPVCILYVDVHKIYTNILCQVFCFGLHTYRTYTKEESVLVWFYDEIHIPFRRKVNWSWHYFSSQSIFRCLPKRYDR